MDANVLSKECKTCKASKPLEDFPLGKNYKGGRRPNCLLCHGKSNKIVRDKNKQGENQRVKKWVANNRDKVRNVYHKRQALKKSQMGVVPDDYWEILISLFGNECMRCGSTTNLQLEHIVPVSKGGLHDMSNFQILCKSCNCSKSTKTIDYRHFSYCYED